MLRKEVGKWRKIKLTKIKIYFLNINALKLKLKTRMWQEKLTMYLQCLFKSSFGTSCIKAINWYCRSYKYTLTDGVRTRHRPPPTSWGPLECNDPIGPLTHVTKLALSIGRLERAHAQIWTCTSWKKTGYEYESWSFECPGSRNVPINQAQPWSFGLGILPRPLRGVDDGFHW